MECCGCDECFWLALRGRLDWRKGMDGIRNLQCCVEMVGRRGFIEGEWVDGYDE